MNTKTTKFLAVLAVLVMAFAAVSVVTTETDATSTHDLGKVNYTYGSGEADHFPIAVFGDSTLVGKQTGSTIAVSGYATTKYVDGMGENEYYDKVSVSLNGSSDLPSITDLKAIMIVQENKSAPFMNGFTSSWYKTGAGNFIKASGANERTSVYSATTFNGTEYLDVMIPQVNGKTTVTLTICLLTSSSDFPNAESGVDAFIEGAETAGTAVTITIDFSKATSVISLIGSADARSDSAAKVAAASEAWEYTYSDTTLALKNLDANLSFEAAGALTVKLTGNNVLTATTENAEPNYGAVIESAGKLTIVPAGAADASLTINQGNSNAYGVISTSTGGVEIGNASDYKTTFTATGAAIAVMANGSNMAIKNADVTVSGAERGLRTGSDGSLTLSDGAVVKATIAGAGSNGSGDDDIFGVKAGSLTVGASCTIDTQGLYVKGTYSNSGFILVKGGYAQNTVRNTHAIAGLELEKGSSATETISATRSDSMGTNPGIYLSEDAGIYSGKYYTVNVTGSSGAVEKDATSTTGETGVKALLSSSANERVNFTTSTVQSFDTDTVVSDSQYLGVTTTDTGSINGELTIGSTDAVKVNFSGVKGQFVITKGSIVIDGEIKEGTITISGNAHVTGAVTGAVVIQAASSLSSTPTVTFDSEFNLSSAATLTLTGVKVAFEATSYTISSGTVTFKDSSIVSNVAFKPAANGSVTIIGNALTVAAGYTFTLGDEYYANVKGTIASGNVVLKNVVTADKMTIGENADVTLTALGTATYVVWDVSGYLQINCDVQMNDGTVFKSGAEVTVASGKTLFVGAAAAHKLTIDEGAKLKVYGAVVADATGAASGDGQLFNNGIIYILDEAAIIPGEVFGSGSIINSYAASDVYLSGDIKDVREYGKLQNVYFNGNVELLATSKITIKGTLYVNEGVTVTIADGAALNITGSSANLVNNGKIIVASDGLAGMLFGLGIDSTARATNNGTIIADYSGALANNVIKIDSYAIFNNKGIVQVNSESNITIADTVKFTNDKDASLVLNGKLAGDIINKSTVTIAGTLAANSKVSNIASGATVVVSALTIPAVTAGTQYTLTIDTDGMHDALSLTGTDIDCTVVLGGAAGTIAEMSISGLTLKAGTAKASIFTGETATKTYPTLALAGVVTGAYTSSTADIATTIKADGKYLLVSDDLTVSKGITLQLQSASKMLVTGNIAVAEGATMAGTGTNPYVEVKSGSVTSITNSVQNVDFAAAKFNAINSDNKMVYYYVPLATALAAGAENIVVPSGYLSISSEVVIPDGTTVTFNGTGVQITADGSVLVEDGGIIKNNSTMTVKGVLTYEDYKTGQKGTGTYASDVVAEDGNSRSYTSLATALKYAELGDYVFLNNDATLETDTEIPAGVILVTYDELEEHSLTVADEKTLINNGTIMMKANKLTLGTDSKLINNGYIMTTKAIGSDTTFTGAQYKVEAEPDDIYVLTTIANAAEEGKDITVFGDANIGDLTMTAASKSDLKTMTFLGDVNAGTITLGFSKVVFSAGTVIKATVADANGSILFNDAYVKNTTDSVVTVVSTVDSDSEPYLGLSGSYTAGYAKIEDDVAVDAVSSFYTLYVEGDLYVLKTLTVDTLYVEGGMYIDNGIRATIDDANVYGTIVAASATDSESKGTLAIGTSLNVGVDLNLAATPVVSGYVDVGTAIVYVVDGAQVSSDITGLSKASKVYVDGDLWMTIYSATAATIYKAVIEATFEVPTGNAEIEKLVDEDGDTIYSFTVGENVYFILNEYIYTVFITTDAGVKSVSIDGIELINEGGSNVFYTDFGTLGSKIVAGTHTVKYTLKEGYEGTPNLYTEAGTILKDYKFICVGTDDDDITVQLQLTGTQKEVTPEPEPTPEPEKESEWNVTTILLLVLVILIAIMAVIVALRLNRN